MKRLIIAALAAVALAGCATSQDKYYEAIKAQAEATNAQQDRIEGQITALAATGDAQAKGMAMAYWIMKGAKGGDSVVRIQPPLVISDADLDRRRAGPKPSWALSPAGKPRWTPHSRGTGNFGRHRDASLRPTGGTHGWPAGPS